MTPFLRWLVAALVSFGTLAGGYHAYLEANPFRVLVIVDSSFPMKTIWPKVTSTLQEVGDRRYTEFSLYSEKNKVHDWQSVLSPDDLVAYAPRNFGNLQNMLNSSEIDDVTEVVFVTNANTIELGEFGDWRVLSIQ